MTIAQKFSTADAIEAYVRTHADGRLPISIADAVRSVRLSIPHCEMTDSELADMIARTAIVNGCSILFDQNEGRTALDPIR